MTKLVDKAAQPVTAVCAKLFAWHKQLKTVIGEMSELDRIHVPVFVKIEGGLGIQVISSKSGICTEWIVTQKHYTEGELTHWTLIPTASTLQCAMGLRGWNMTIFND